MKKGIIITLPDYDVVTNYLSQFSKEIIKEAEDQGVNTKKIEGKNVKRREVESILDSFPYKFVFFNGHGTDKIIFGQGENEHIIIEGINEEILRDRIVYARACDAAASLGKVIVGDQHQKSCFIGYQSAFEFYHDVNWESNPLKDKVAEVFLASANIIPSSIIKGRTAREAAEKARTAMLKTINKLLRKNDKDAIIMANSLWNNYMGQVILGDEEATI